MASIGERFFGSEVTQASTRSSVQKGLDVAQFSVLQVTKATALGKELSYQAIGVFIGSALPRAVGLGEVDLQVQGFGQPRMLSELAAVVEGDRMAA